MNDAIIESLKRSTVFKFKGEAILYFIAKVDIANRFGGIKRFKIIGEDASVDWLAEYEMEDVDPSTIRKYDPDVDIDFYGLDM